MTKLRNTVLWLFIIFLILTGCQSSADEDELKGRFTIWHSWSNADEIQLEAALQQFEEIHPQVHISTISIPEDQMLPEFYRLGEDGLGPGLMIGDDAWISDLANAGLIRPFSTDPFSASFFNARNRNLVEYNDEIYGVPMSLAPYALYYNKNRVTEPPSTLDDLLTAAKEGSGVAFVPRFSEAYWGIQTFGDGLFDPIGRFTLAESGFTEWLAWLNTAQGSPGVILNVDDESLLELFATGQIDFYVNEPAKQYQILSRMREDNSFEIGVVPLPQGPEGSAGPLLKGETILLYAYASQEQAKIAQSLALFLVNQQQSIRFLRETDRVPANPTVRVDNRIYPVANGFAQQARTAVVLPNDIPVDPFVAAGNRAYITVLAGTVSPEEAVCQFGLDVAEIMAYTSEEMDLPEDCVQTQE